MIRFKTGDSFGDDAEALVNAVNCVGVMGRGLALQFTRRFPDSFGAYDAKCKPREIQPGRVFVFGTSLLDGPSYIVNFPTKRHWREKSRLEDTQSGLKSLKQEITRARNPFNRDPGSGKRPGRAPLVRCPREHGGRTGRPRRRQHCDS